MQARYYDPVIGHFYSNDPVGTLGHLYGSKVFMVATDMLTQITPLTKYTDPDGKVAHCIAGHIGVAVCLGQALNAVHKAYRAYKAGQVVVAIADSSPERAGEGGQEPSEIKVREGAKSGGKSNPDSDEITYPDGMRKDIDPTRV